MRPGALGSIATTLAGLLLVTFLIGHVVPVDPVLSVVGDRASQASHDAARRVLGLDAPLHERFVGYVLDVLRGDLGTSLLTGRPVADDLRRVFPATLELATVAIVLGTLLGVPLGVASAARRGGALDRIVRIVGLVGHSAPIFWLGLMGLMLLYARWGLVPGPGRIDIVHAYAVETRTGLLLVDAALQGRWDAWRDAAAHLALPAGLLGWFSMACIARMARALVLAELGREYVVAARIKGVPERRVVWVHALGNAAAPLLAVVALSYASLLEGSVLIETVFAWPGLGSYLTDSLLSADLNAVLGCTLLVGTSVVALNFVADGLGAALDPRLRRIA